MDLRHERAARLRSKRGGVRASVRTGIAQRRRASTRSCGDDITAHPFQLQEIEVVMPLGSSTRHLRVEAASGAEEKKREAGYMRCPVSERGGEWRGPKSCGAAAEPASG